MLGLCCCLGFSLVAASGSYSLAHACGAWASHCMASLVVEHGL